MNNQIGFILNVQRNRKYLTFANSKDDGGYVRPQDLQYSLAEAIEKVANKEWAWVQLVEFRHGKLVSVFSYQELTGWRTENFEPIEWGSV